jgi:hypothetical protein
MPTILPPSDPRLSQNEEWRAVHACVVAVPTVANESIGGAYIPYPARLRRFRGQLRDCRSSTVIEVRVNGVAVAGSAVTIANTAPDNTTFSVSLDVALAAGDLVQVVATAGATAALGLVTQADFVRDY